MAGYGLDVAGHLSRQVTAHDLAHASLILAMTREHLRQAVVIAPDAWPRAFTIRELVRRGAQAVVGPPGESLDEWLARVHDGRSRMALLGDSPQDDIEGPIGGPLAAYEATAGELAGLTATLASMPGPRPAEPIGIRSGIRGGRGQGGLDGEAAQVRRPFAARRAALRATGELGAQPTVPPAGSRLRTTAGASGATGTCRISG